MDELTRVEQITDPAERAKACGAYIAQAEARKQQAVALRRAAIREVLKEHGPTETARLCGVSVSLVKQVRNS